MNGSIVEDNAAAVEVMATTIESIAKSAKSLLNGRLDRKAIHLLIREKCPKRITIKDIEIVLDAAASLHTFVRKAPAS